MIISVVLELKYTPNQIDSLFLDYQDHWGLEYWYDNIKKREKQLEKAVKGK